MPVAMDTVHKGVAEERYKLGAVIEDLWEWTLYLQTGAKHFNHYYFLRERSMIGTFDYPGKLVFIDEHTGLCREKGLCIG